MKTPAKAGNFFETVKCFAKKISQMAPFFFNTSASP